MHVTYRYHCEGPHTLYYNHRHARLFLSLSLNIEYYKKMHLKVSNLTPPMIFRIFKNRNICESPIHQETSNKFSSKSDKNQRSNSNFSNGVKIAKFSETFASKPPNFRLFSTFYSDSKSLRWEESNGVRPIKIGRLVLEIWGGANRPPPVNPRTADGGPGHLSGNRTKSQKE